MKMQTLTTQNTPVTGEKKKSAAGLSERLAQAEQVMRDAELEFFGAGFVGGLNVRGFVVGEEFTNGQPKADGKAWDIQTIVINSGGQIFNFKEFRNRTDPASKPFTAVHLGLPVKVRVTSVEKDVIMGVLEYEAE